MRSHLFVLYTVHPDDKPSSSFNCAVFPPSTPPTLSSLIPKMPNFGNPHFRVRVDSKSGYEYYDITDESDELPVTTTDDIDFLTCPRQESTGVKGLVKGLKGLTKQNDGARERRTYRVLILKILELDRVMGATSSAPRPRTLHHRAPPSRPILKPRTPPRPTLVNLPKTPPTTPKTPTHNPTFADLHHQSRGSGASQSSSPRSSPPPPPPPPPKTRAESLRASYLASQTTDKSWDEVDERWVPSKRKSAPLFSTPHAKAAELLPRAKTEAEVKASQKDAVKEFRKRASAAEDEQTSMDAARTKLEPKIKTWSTEHNKIKHLRTLLSTLHLILWEKAKWKQLSLGDLLDDSKLKRYYFKASLVVHPDKVGDLGAEEKFIAARVFDALTLAKENAGI